jgi:hypothetical protein
MKKAYAVIASVMLVLALTWPGEAKPKRWPCVPAEWYESTCQVLSDGVVTGSGVCVGKDRIVTAAHVLVGSEITIQYRKDGLWHVHLAEIGAVDAVHDVAELKVSFCEMAVAPLAKAEPGWGEPVMIIGCPQRHEPMPQLGFWGGNVPAWVDAYRPGLKAITAPNHVGTSGAPVWDLNEGAVVGITSCKDSEFHHLSYIAPVEIIKGVLDGE